MPFKAKTMWQDSNSETVDVDVVQKRSWKKVHVLWQWIAVSAQQVH